LKRKLPFSLNLSTEMKIEPGVNLIKLLGAYFVA